MKRSDFSFELPESLIAKYPVSQRDQSRLMVVNRTAGTWEHKCFADLPELLSASDLLVVNNTKVLAARLRAERPSGGRHELLLVQPLTANNIYEWKVMATNSRKLKPETELSISETNYRACILSSLEDGFFAVRFEEDPRDIAQKIGEIPLPPYLKRAPEEGDKEWYQTLFADEAAVGSVAAPTAGLHFTPRLMDALAQKGFECSEITLHVGPGTFLPVRAEYLDDHRMHAEHYVVDGSAADKINAAGSVVAVGTTVTRVLESFKGPLTAVEGSTDIFIRPGHRFRHVQKLITNFHLPESTLLMLVSAFAGRELMLDAYQDAVKEKYRFFSYGDAMLIQ